MREVTRHDVSFLVNTNTINADFWNIENWESENYIKIYDISKTTNTFVNAGGWIGTFTLFAGKIFKNVFSLEPDPIAFQELKSNVDLNALKNIKIYNKAFNNKNDIITIGSDYSELGRSGSSIFQSQNSVEIEAVTLESFFSAENIAANSLLMLDVEGAEYLLFDNYNFFKTYKPIILLSLHLTFLSDDNFNFLIEGLRKLEDIYELDLQLILLNRLSSPFQGPFKELNILMTPKI